MTEIERKFLVIAVDFKKEATKKEHIAQGFLNTDAERTVRVRIKGNKGYITIKGKSNKSGTSRFEWEKEIPIQEAKELLKLCEEIVIEKIRYKIPVGNHVYEVDEFHGDNEGLYIAEVELQDENEAFQKPTWLGEEVTGQNQYYNSQLSKNPYKNWSQKEDPMLGLRTCAYKVSDLQKAKKWYAKAFEATPYFDELFYVGFNIGGYELGLLPEEKASSEKADSVLTYWGVLDIEIQYQRMLALGATPHETPTNVGGELMVATVKDPWNNIIGLIYNPYFQLK